MTWRAIPAGASAKLGDYRRYPGCRLLIACTACGWVKDFNAERVIARLHQLRAGGYPTALTEVAARVRGRCRQCRKVAWRAEFAWPPGMDEREVKRLANLYRN